MEELLRVFSDIAKKLGYSEAHGRILGVLLLYECLPLQEIAKKTRYSISTVSVAVDFLEIFGMVKKERRGRKIYVKLTGDLLEGLKKAVFMKIMRSIGEAKEKVREVDGPGADRFLQELDRIEEYIRRLNRVEIPRIEEIRHL